MPTGATKMTALALSAMSCAWSLRRLRGALVAVLNWSRLDANISTNHKTLALLGMKGGEHALLVYLFSHGYCTGHGTDGFIPKAAIGTFHGTAKDAALLVDVGFWDLADGGGRFTTG